MANRWAVANGNYNTAATWNDPGGGATVPASNDDVYSNNYTVQCDVDVTANTLRNTANADIGVVAGGIFNHSASADRSITATNGFYAVGNTAAVLSVTSNTPYTTNIAGDLMNNGRWFTFAGTGNINFTGNMLNGWNSGYNCGGIYSSNTGVVNLTGIYFPGTYFPAGLQYNEQVKERLGWSFYNAGVGTVNITGSINGNNNGYCVVNASTGRVNITGTATSGSAVAGHAIYSTTAGIVQVVGIVDMQTPPTTNCPAIYLTTGTFYAAALIYNRGTTMAVVAAKMALLTTGPTSWQMADEGAGTKTLYTTDTAMFGYPAEDDTRDGTIYGQTNEFEGTCVVPTAANVLQGVPVDATTGTALMTPADFWDYAKASATTTGSMGEMCVNIDKKTGLIPATL